MGSGFLLRTELPYDDEMRKSVVFAFLVAGSIAGQTIAEDAALQNLTASLQLLRHTGSSTAADRDQISSDILAVAEQSHRPSLSTVAAFTSRLTRAIAGRRLSDLQLFRLASDIDTILHSAGLGYWKFKEAISGTEAVLTSVGVDAASARRVAVDLEAVGKEVRGPEGVPAIPLR